MCVCVTPLLLGSSLGFPGSRETSSARRGLVTLNIQEATGICEGSVLTFHVLSFPTYSRIRFHPALLYRKWPTCPLRGDLMKPGPLPLSFSPLALKHPPPPFYPQGHLCAAAASCHPQVLHNSACVSQTLLCHTSAISLKTRPFLLNLPLKWTKYSLGTP